MLLLLDGDEDDEEAPRPNGEGVVGAKARTRSRDDRTEDIAVSFAGGCAGKDDQVEFEDGSLEDEGLVAAVAAGVPGAVLVLLIVAIVTNEGEHER